MEWSEEQHPRDDDGQFTSGPGGATAPEKAPAKTEAPAPAEFDETEVYNIPESQPKPQTEDTGKGYRAISNPTIEADNGNDTEAVFRNPDGSWKEERQTLHKEIIDDLFQGATPVAEGETPTFNLMGGGAAAGKSRVMKSLDLPSQVTIDSDHFKTKIPEYQKMLDQQDHRAAAFSHEESSALSKQALTKAVDGNFNCTLDGTGDSSLEKLRKKVQQAHDAGYRVVANYVTVPTEMAIERNRERAKKTGRMPPEEFVRQVHASVSRVFPQAVDEGLFDEVTLWDNSGGEPKQIFSHKDGKSETHDDNAYQEFLKKADQWEKTEASRRKNYRSSSKRRYSGASPQSKGQKRSINDFRMRSKNSKKLDTKFIYRPNRESIMIEAAYNEYYDWQVQNEDASPRDKAEVVAGIADEYGLTAEDASLFAKQLRVKARVRRIAQVEPRDVEQALESIWLDDYDNEVGTQSQAKVPVTEIANWFMGVSEDDVRQAVENWQWLKIEGDIVSYASKQASSTFDSGSGGSNYELLEAECDKPEIEEGSLGVGQPIVDSRPSQQRTVAGNEQVEQALFSMLGDLGGSASWAEVHSWQETEGIDWDTLKETMVDLVNRGQLTENNSIVMLSAKVAQMSPEMQQDYDEAYQQALDGGASEREAKDFALEVVHQMSGEIGSWMNSLDKIGPGDRYGSQDWEMSGPPDEEEVNSVTNTETEPVEIEEAGVGGDWTNKTTFWSSIHAATKTAERWVLEHPYDPKKYHSDYTNGRLVDFKDAQVFTDDEKAYVDQNWGHPFVWKTVDEVQGSKLANDQDTQEYLHNAKWEEYDQLQARRPWTDEQGYRDEREEWEKRHDVSAT